MLSTLVRVHSLSVVCILKTRVRINNRVRNLNSILLGWELHHNYEHAELGRIWVCWNPRVVKIVHILCNDQAMLCYITVLEDNSFFLCSAIYASNNQVNRRVLWSHLQLCASKVGSKPWLLMGDFNTTRLSSEKNGGNMSTDTAMEEFHECLFNLELDDMPFNGPLFTWINRRVGDQFIARKLDRSLQNECALDMFPCAVTEVGLVEELLIEPLLIGSNLINNTYLTSKMGAGVSLSLSRDGVHGESICSSSFSLISDPFPREHDFYVVSVPFSREQVYYGKCIFPVFQAVNGNVCSISCLHVIHVGSAPYTKEHGLNGKICLWEVRDLPMDDASPVLQQITRCCGSLASAHKLPISGRQDSGRLGARVTDQALWNLDLLESVLTRSSMTAVNHALPATTFGIYFGSDGAEVVDLVAAFGIADADVIYVAAADYVAGALATDLQIYGQPYSDVVRSVMEDRENSSRFGQVGMGKQLPPFPSRSGSGYVKTSGVDFPTNTIAIFAVENFGVAGANCNVVAP